MKDLRSRQWLLLAVALVLLGAAAYQVEIYLKIKRDWERVSTAKPPTEIQTAPGFKVSLVYSADHSEGSWICMTADDQGRLIVSPEGDEPLLRLTVNGDSLEKIEPIPQPVNAAMGLLYARHSLYLDCQGPKGRGIYRMIDKDGIFGAPELLRTLDMPKFEHGAHAIILGPDEKLYIVCGDYAALPAYLSSESPLRNEAEDQLLPRAEDPQGMGLALPPHGGFVLRMDLDGNKCELFAGGTRNIYDIAFNSDGELFGFDSDAEYDFGLPWYRPIRINHLVSGGDYGYRQGTGKFPEYYEDTLPATLNAGIGSPTGVAFAPKNCAFPPPYREACFMEDWAYGRLFAVHFSSRGATYNARMETVLRGQPLNLTAMTFGIDGSLYFITGGRVTRSGLYRLTWTGPTTQETTAKKDDAAAARQLRHKLESFHGRRDPRAADLLWPALHSDDRWIRYAARVALESQDAGLWKDRALAETNDLGGLTALLALARCGGKQMQPDLLKAMEKFPLSRLGEEEALLKLRVLELSFIRQGRPAAEQAGKIIDELDSHFPSASENENHELCQMLLYLGAPDAIGKSLALIKKASTQEEQIYYAMRLRTITNGWTLPQRKEYLSWFRKDLSHAGHPPDLLQYFKDAGENYSDGNRLVPYLDGFRQEAAATLDAEERLALAAYLPEKPKPAPVLQSPGKFVKAWTMADLEPHLAMANNRRRKAAGMRIFFQTQCALCHHFGGVGGFYGPDLAAVGSRMTARDILESILEPSKAVAQQYQNTLLTLKDGDVVLGRVLGEDSQKLFLFTDPASMERTTILKADIVSRRLSKISPMPEGLANSLTEDQIWDLVSCLKAGFRSAAPP